MKGLLLVAASLLAAFGGAGAARAGTISAELDRREGKVGEPFQLEVQIAGNWDDELVPPVVPGLRFHEVTKHGATQITNGRRVSHLAVTYAVFAEAPGTYTIPSFSLVIDGEAVSTVPLEIVVADGPGGTAPAAPQGAAEAQTQTRMQPPAEVPARAEQTAGVFMERDCGARKPFVGEQIVCSAAVLDSGNFRSEQPVLSTPATTDFRFFPVEGATSRLVLIGKKRHRMTEFRHIVIPTKGGKLELPPFGLRGAVVSSKRRRFGGGLFNFDLDVSDLVELFVETPKSTIEARPLPEAGKPAGFQGLVGRFELTASVSKPQVKTGDTVTITIAIQGDGILDSLSEPSIDVSKLGKVYPDKPAYQERADGTRGIVSQKTFKVALVPSVAGSHALGKVEVPVFDPKREEYVVLTADLGTLEVAPGAAEEKPVVVGEAKPEATQQGVKVLGGDVLGPHPLADLEGRDDLDPGTVAAAAAAGGVPLLAALGLFAVRAVRERKGRDVAGVRRSQAYRRFKSTLGAAQSAVGEGQVEGGVSEAHKALRVYLGDVLNRRGEAFTARDVQTEMERLGLPEARRAAAQQLVERFEQAAFGGRAPDRQLAGQWLEELDRIVKEVDAAC